MNESTKQARKKKKMLIKIHIPRRFHAPEEKKRMEAVKRRRRRVLLCPHTDTPHHMAIVNNFLLEMQLIDSAAISDMLVHCCVCTILFLKIFFLSGTMHTSDGRKTAYAPRCPGERHLSLKQHFISMIDCSRQQSARGDRHFTVVAGKPRASGRPDGRHVAFRCELALIITIGRISGCRVHTS